jgi:chain length determinant protein (polysaccharide antigen chain regulator)
VEQNQSPAYSSDEIDLRELVLTLWSSKLLIILITLIVTGMAAAYAFLSTPIYQTQVQTLPPAPSGLSSYNMANQLSGPAITAVTWSGEKGAPSENSVPPLTPEDAYKVFLRHVSSVSLRQEFFKTTYLPAHGTGTETRSGLERLWKQFNDELTITPPRSAADNNLLKLTLEGEDPTTIANWANQYTQMAIDAAQKELLENLSSAIHLRRQSTEDQISTLRKIAKTDRQNDVIRLQEALALAESIGLDNPSDTGNLITSYTGQTMYLRGAKALRAELALLEGRVSDDPYIPQLPDLMKKQLLLSNIDLNPERLSVATIDQAASIPEDPIKPRKALILVLGFILGGILAVFFVLIRKLLKPR